jgi:predicted CopG family antitoxin
VHGSEDGHDRHGSLRLLSRHKREGQSFSQVVKEHFSGAKKGRDLIAALREVSLSEETLDAIEAQVKKRGASIAKAPKL